MKFRDTWRAFLDGMASAFDITGSFYSKKTNEILSRSDADALRSDWEAIGKDFPIQREDHHADDS